MQEILSAYYEKKFMIGKRLDDFTLFYSSPVSWFYSNNEMALKPVTSDDNTRIFEELVFCILTANTSAISGMKAVDSIRNVLSNGSIEDVKKGLIQTGYRFPNTRTTYIIETRENFKDKDFKEIIQTYTPIELREFFVQNVKGFGYKEASHFLRNIGIKGLAILDKHILRTLLEYKVIDEMPKTLNRKRYHELENKLIDFSHQLKINIDELDLLLWSMKTGNIMK